MGDFNSQHNRAVWFDVPCADLDRAAEFYRTVLGCGVSKEQFDETSFCVIDHEQGNGGCLILDADAPTATGGILVYLNVDGRIRDAVAQAESHGGTIVETVHSIGPHGFRAIVIDSEGNRLALHSNNDA